MTVDGGYGTVDEILQVVVPQAGTNLCTNPSFEVSTAGWTATSATITRTAGAGTFGAYGGRMLASATNGKIAFTAAAVANGSQNALAMWVRADSASVSLKGTIGATNASQAHPGDGQWHRLSVSVTAPSATTPVLEIIDGRSSAWTNVDTDGATIETGVAAPTTYLDGDQPGCSWVGTPHLSQSTREARDGRGGAVSSFKSLGLNVTALHGVGTPPVENLNQRLAMSDGALFQGARKRDRVMTLMGVIFGSGTPASLHTIRGTLLDAFGVDVRTNRGPVLLRYTGNGNADPRVIEAYYEAGLEWEDVQAADQEIPLRFWCPDPDWRREIQAGATLTAVQTVSPVSAMAMRNTDGTWTSLGGGVAANINALVYVTEDLLDGRTVIAGTACADFGGVAAADNLAVWDGAAMAVLGSAAPNGGITCGAFGFDGKLYISGPPGSFSTVGGQTVNGIAKWDGSAWSVVGTGGISSSLAFVTLAIDPTTGYLWGAGTTSGGAEPTTVGGVTINGLGFWNGTTWTALSQTGLPSGWGTLTPQSLTAGPDGRMYMAITSATTKGIYVWNGASWTLFAASTGTSNAVYALLSARGKLYAAGYFTGLGGVTVSNIAEVSGAGISSMGGGIAISAATGARSLAITKDGLVLVAGQNFTAVGGVAPLDNLGIWDGSTWRPFAVNTPNTATPANDLVTVRGTRTGRVLVGWTSSTGTFGTSLSAEAITSVTNAGSAPAYPVITFDSSGSVLTLANLTTGQRIDFSGLTLATGEVAALDLRPGRKTFATAVRNLIATVVPGSDMATFCLAPGVNRISVYATSGTVSMSWDVREISAD